MNRAKRVLEISIILLVCIVLFVACDIQSTDNLSNTDTNTITSVVPDAEKPENDTHSHSFSQWKTVKEATCTEEGLAEQTCSCGEKNTQIVSMLAHSEVIDASIAPTCTQSGLTEGKHCSVCSKVIQAQGIIDASGHVEIINHAVKPTCTKAGLTEGKYCSACNIVLLNQKPVDALGHTEVVDLAVEPTCTKTGLTEGKHCSVCNLVITPQEIVEACGHTEVTDHAVKPTCTKTGLTEGKHCSVCSLVIVPQKNVDALGHTEVVDHAVEPTCTKTGLTEGKHCSVCNAKTKEQTIINTVDHIWVLNSTDAPAECSECNTKSVSVKLSYPSAVYQYYQLGQNLHSSKLEIRSVKLEYLDEDTIRISGTCYTDYSMYNQYCYWTLSYKLTQNGTKISGGRLLHTSGASDADKLFEFSRTIDLTVGGTYTITLDE